jgi:hypothetical protein
MAVPCRAVAYSVLADLAAARLGWSMLIIADVAHGQPGSAAATLQHIWQAL